MGLGDKFKQLTKQAQDLAVEHREQLHDAVDVASVAADRRTRGKHSAKIAKAGDKAAAAIDRFGAGEGTAAGAPAGVDGAEPGSDSPPAGQ
jgi:MT0933-like antitoxin protein